MKTALIGYTGFVGSNIARQMNFDEYYNSRNINEIQGNSYDLVVCAGVPAVKWWANQNPAEDLLVIQRLIEIYRSVQAKRFVLVSTVDVYPSPVGVSESTEIDLDSVQPYGRHRLLLEQALQGAFENLHVVRLPGLFGLGLKKNILFDMLCHNILEKINLQSRFQWYPLARIWQDIQTVIAQELPLVNFAVEPLDTHEIWSKFFPELNVGGDPFPLASYDIQSEHAVHFGGQGAYLMSRSQVIQMMQDWLINPEVKCG
ncbi:MAG: hypothetical protein B7Y40_06925 [Gammaproteobacteria bacterium 28-57-27]|nr:MAG: hypothetical protein B7Y40_06925 [Gammaproteobacteria bacterium 28-57-27]